MTFHDEQTELTIVMTNKRVYTEEEEAYLRRLMSQGADRERAEWYLNSMQTWTNEDYGKYMKFHRWMMGEETGNEKYDYAKDIKQLNAVLEKGNFEILKKNVRIPLLVHIPHSSTAIPEEIRKTFLISDAELQKELLLLTDRYTDDLFASAVEFGGIAFVCRQGRMVVDPERFPDDRYEPMSQKGMGIIYTKTSDGQTLRKKMTEVRRNKLLEQYYLPYRQAMEDEVDKLLETYGNCLIVDCHSFSSLPLPFEPDLDPDRPDICIGTDPFHTPPTPVKKAEECFKSAGFSVKLNKPYSGTYVPLKHFGKDKRVSSVMIEVNRKLYMAENSGKKLRTYHSIKDALRTIIEELASATFFRS